ncbi:unnamed protein product [Rhizophagus irregularis]|nr:unnamed protein product [Rhizophagus irregularis]
MKEKGLRTIILVIVRDYIERNLENEVFDRLIGNPELVEHKYILEGWDVERRFEKFWQWYRVALGEIRAVKAEVGAIEKFKELLYEEEKIAESEEEVKGLMQGIIYENIEIDNVQEHHKNMIQKIIRIFIDTRGFTKEPEDSESEGSPASYELENSSEEELEIIIGDKSWKFSELKRRTSSIDEDQLRYIWKIGIKLMIEMDILVTKIFIDKVQEVEEMDEREKELEIREWLEKETVICKRCGNRRFEMDRTDNECGECIKEMQKDEQDELAELKDDLEKLGYEIDVSEIQRIKSFGVNNRIIITKEFVEEYMEMINLEDKELRKEIHKWLNENTTWCERCEIRWMNDMFRLGGTVCKDCEEEDIDEIDDRIKRLQKIFEDIGIMIIEEELLRLTSMGYTDGEILDKEFIEIFQENKNESEKELKKKLDKLLKEQAGVIDSEESGEKSDNEESEEDNTDNSEKIGEILSPEEYEIWDGSDEDFEEEESENEIENVINTGGLDAMLGYHVRRSNPTNLNDAVNEAKREEEAKDELLMKTTGLDMKRVGQEKNMEEILKEETNKYKGMNPIAKELQNKEVKSDEWDELINGMKRLEAHVMQRNEAYVMQRNGNDRRPIGNNNVQRNNMNWDRMTCYTCGRKGHTSRVCREGQRRSYGGNNKGSYSQNNQVNYLDEEYYGEGYNVYNMEYNDEYDGYNEGDGYDNYNNGFDGYEVNNYEDEERYDMFPVPPRKSERNKDKVMNDERDRRRNAQWQGQQQKAQGNNKRGFTKEQLQKGYETRKNNNRCHNCGQQGHFARECTNEKVKLNRNIPNVGDFDPFEQFVNSSVPINWGQMMNERPEVRKKLLNGLRY